MGIEIFTSCWMTYRGPGRIGISRGSPRGGPGGYRMYRALAPTKDILQNAKAQDVYRRRFFAEVLDLLDPQKVLADLEERSEEGRAVLLCFERPPFHANNWCHRTMVANWITRETGVPVLEWSGAQESNLQAKLDV